MANLEEYYCKRAEEYEAIYHRQDAVRQEEQRRIAAALKKHLAGRRQTIANYL